MDVQILIESIVNGQVQDHKLLDEFVLGVASGEVSVEEATAWLKGSTQTRLQC